MTIQSSYFSLNIYPEIILYVMIFNLSSPTIDEYNAYISEQLTHSYLKPRVSSVIAIFYGGMCGSGGSTALRVSLLAPIQKI